MRMDALMRVTMDLYTTMTASPICRRVSWHFVKGSSGIP